MKNIKVLGTGCSKCKQLAENAEAAAQALGVDYEVTKVTKIQDIMAFGVMVTPALVVDGEVKVAGRVPGLDEMKKMLG